MSPIVLRTWFFCAVLPACVSLSTAIAQEKVNIRTIRSQTADAVAFTISVPQSSYAPNQNIVINYTVANNSKKVAYLVLEPQPQTNVDEKNRFIRLESPVKYQEEWNRYDNDLIRLAPGRSFSGKLVIPGTQTPVNPKSDAESWQMQVVFGYVFDPAKADIDELLACKDTSYSFPCLGKLNDIAKIVAVGNMVVEVRSR
jgi:hypothetical protein